MTKHVSKTTNISGQEILAMLHQKGVCLMALANQNRFANTDIMDVIHAKQTYPNIARIVANEIGTTKEMLWPSIYCSAPNEHQPHTSIFVLRVELA